MKVLQVKSETLSRLFDQQKERFEELERGIHTINHDKLSAKEFH